MVQLQTLLEIPHRETVFENLTRKLDATNIKYFEMNLFFNDIFLCLVSELFVRSLVRFFTMVCTWHVSQTRNSTELSKHIWTLKGNNIDHSISWRIISSSSSYNSSRKRCNICLKEKFLIICRPDLSSFNKRNEHASSCKALLRNN